MSLFSKIFNIFKPKPKLSKTQLNKIIHQSISKNEKFFENLGDDMDYDGMGNYGRFPSEKSSNKKRLVKSRKKVKG